MTVREGAWDCDVCGRAANRGPEKHCPGCGHPRGPEVELYLPEEAPEVTDRAALDRALAGPDWSCEHCGGDNRAEYAHCTGCGAPRGEAPERAVVERRGPQYARSPEPPSPEPSPTAGSRRPSKARRRELRRKARRRGCSRPLLWGLAGLAALVALVAWCGRTSEATATVSGFAWERSIEIERQVTVTETALPSQVPDDARRLDPAGGAASTRTVTERVQVGTERVKVGVRDLGNGFFEDVYEDRPVYEIRRREVPTRGPPASGGGQVRYQVERWRTVRTARASGDDRAPRWPATGLEEGEREGERSEALYVVLTDGLGARWRYRASDEAAWRRFTVGESYRLEGTAGGTVRSLERR